MNRPSTSIDGTQEFRTSCCVVVVYADGGFETNCHVCGEEIAYGSLYGTDGAAKQVEAAKRHERKRHPGDCS